MGPPRTSRAGYLRRFDAAHRAPMVFPGAERKSSMSVAGTVHLGLGQAAEWPRCNRRSPGVVAFLTIDDSAVVDDLQAGRRHARGETPHARHAAASVQLL